MIAALPLSAIPDADEALRAEVRSFARDAIKDVAPEIRARSWMGFSPEYSRALAARGWLGLSIRKEDGGQASDAEPFQSFREAAHAPSPLHTRDEPNPLGRNCRLDGKCGVKRR